MAACTSFGRPWGPSSDEEHEQGNWPLQNGRLKGGKSKKRNFIYDTLKAFLEQMKDETNKDSV